MIPGFLRTSNNELKSSARFWVDAVNAGGVDGVAQQNGKQVQVQTSIRQQLIKPYMQLSYVVGMK